VAVQTGNALARERVAQLGVDCVGHGRVLAGRGGLVVDGADHGVGLQPEVLETRQRDVEAGGSGEATFGRFGEA